MARKTAMGKEPGNVSVALPQSEKDRLRGGGQRMPGKPRPMDDKGNFTDKQSLDRLSPGVYRNSQGKLVGSKGQALPKRSPIQNALQGAAQAAGQQTNIQPAPRPGQQFSQQEIDAGIQAGNLANSMMEQYPNLNMGNQQPVAYPNQMQPGIVASAQGPQFSIQDFTPNKMLSYLERYDPQARNMYNYFQQQQQQMRQQQAPAQPNSVSGLLRQGR